MYWTLEILSLLLLLLLYKLPVTISTAPGSLALWDQMVNKCPQIKNNKKFSEQSVFKICQNFDNSIKTINSATTNKEDLKALLCEIYLDSFIPFCTTNKQIMNVTLPMEEIMGYTLSQVCKDVAIAPRNVSSFYEIIKNEENCNLLCEDISGDPNRICATSYYYRTQTPLNVDNKTKNQENAKGSEKNATINTQSASGQQSEPQQQLQAEEQPPPQAQNPEPQQSNVAQPKTVNQSNIENQKQENDKNSNSHNVQMSHGNNVTQSPVEQPNAEPQKPKQTNPIPQKPPMTKTESDIENVKPSEDEIKKDESPKAVGNLDVPENKKPPITNAQNEENNPPKSEPDGPETKPSDNKPDDINDTNKSFEEEDTNNANVMPSDQMDYDDTKMEPEVPKPEKIDESINSESDMDGDSYFFSYFMVLCVLFVMGYIGYHNKQKILALILEGRRGRRQQRGRRPNSANYHKLDSNLEEAISSSCSKNTNNVIY